MKVFRELRNLPQGEKVLKRLRFSTILEMPVDMNNDLFTYWRSLKFIPKVEQCIFHITDAGNCIVTGIDKQELEDLYKLAYSRYIERIKSTNRHESFNGLCYATRREFIDDCKSDELYIRVFLKKKEFERYQWLKGLLEVAAA